MKWYQYYKNTYLILWKHVMTELKLELDKTHKCLLLKDSKIKDKIVNDRVNFRNTYVKSYHRSILLWDYFNTEKIRYKKQQQKKSKVKKILKRDLVSNRKYKTTYKDIKKYFNIINKSVFKNMLHTV